MIDILARIPVDALRVFETAARRLTPKIARFRDWLLDTARADPAVVAGARLARREVGQVGG